MNISWNFTYTSPLWRWFVYRAGIPVLFFSLGVLIGTAKPDLIPVAVVLGLPGLLLLDRLLGNRACNHPVRLFAASAAALLLASLCAWLSPAVRGEFFTASWLQRLERWRELQHVVEAIWSLETTAYLGVVWLVLFVLARVARTEVAAPEYQPPRHVGATLLVTLILFVMGTFGLSLLANSDLGPRDEASVALASGGELVKVVMRHYPDWRLDGAVHRVKGKMRGPIDARQSAMLEEVAERIEEPSYSLSRDDKWLLRQISEACLSEHGQWSPQMRSASPVAQGSMAKVFAAKLALSRRMGKEFLNLEDVLGLRDYTLPWLAQAPLEKAQIAVWRERAEHLRLTPKMDLESIRDPFCWSRPWELEQEPTLRLLGRNCDFSLPGLAFEAECRWAVRTDEAPAREAQLKALQPERNALLLVLEIKEHKRRTGNYPETLVSPLAVYRKTEDGARLHFHSCDGWRLPVTVNFR